MCSQTSVDEMKSTDSVGQAGRARVARGEVADAEARLELRRSTAIVAAPSGARSRSGLRLQLVPQAPVQRERVVDERRAHDRADVDQDLARHAERGERRAGS